MRTYFYSSLQFLTSVLLRLRYTGMSCMFCEKLHESNYASQNTANRYPETLFLSLFFKSVVFTSITCSVRSLFLGWFQWTGGLLHGILIVGIFFFVVAIFPCIVFFHFHYLQQYRCLLLLHLKIGKE